MIALPDHAPLDPRGRLITDPAAVIALRMGVALNQEQADRMRALVAAVRAPLQRTADTWGVTVAVVARIRLAERAAARRIEKPSVPSWPFTREIIGPNLHAGATGGE